MEKKLFAVSAILVIAAIVFVTLYFMFREDPATTTDSVNVNDPAILDTDKDGLTDERERSLGTSTTDPDTDGDLLNDFEEVTEYKTDPTSQDTDNDGFSDKREIDNGFNPLVK